MELVELGSVELVTASRQVLDFGSGGQTYAEMTGHVRGERISGSLQLTNLTARRADNVNQPMLRGILTTPEAVPVWMELDGIATLRPSDGARTFVTACRLRAKDERYSWVNSILGLLEGVFDSVEVGGAARGVLFECRSTIS